MPRGIEATGNATIGEEDKIIAFCVMSNTPVITLTPEYAELYGERINDNGKLYDEILDWVIYWKEERYRNDAPQTVNSPAPSMTRYNWGDIVEEGRGTSITIENPDYEDAHTITTTHYQGRPVTVQDMMNSYNNASRGF